MLNNLSREQQLIILGLCFLLVTGLVVMVIRRNFTGSFEEIGVENSDTVRDFVTSEQTRELLVHVTGAVKKQGVYQVKEGDRILNVLTLAGGVSALADLSALNLAEQVKDGQKIVVPAKKIVDRQTAGLPDCQTSGKSGNKTQNKNILVQVNLNTASVKELCQVKGIGPKMAQTIVEYRDKNGPFTKLDDLTKVKGIGKGKFSKIKEQIIL